MAADRRRQALLGRLAALGWFTEHGEVAATQAVAMLLEDAPLRDGLLRRLGEITETDLGAVASFQAELVHDDLARPDLEGWDSRCRPVVVIEAKFGALLTTAQFQAYIRYQAARLDGGVCGALIALVPSYRRPEAEAALSMVGDRAGARNAPAPPVATAVMTWEELLGVWDDAAGKLPADERDAIGCDLRQLRALCHTMAALDIIAPLGLVATGGAGRMEREGDLRRLVAEATAGFRHPSGLLPLGTERWPEFSYYRRYMPGSVTNPDCLCAVGVVDRLGGDGTPFWLRYHRDTPDFQAVAERIMASRFAADARGEGGHVWLPLRASADRSGAAIVGELIEQIQAIRVVADGVESASSRFS